MRRPILVFLLALLFSGEFWSHFQIMADEAVVVYGSQRILWGEWPYRDWDTHLSPGPFLLGALWFGLLGFHAPATRLLFGLTFALTALAIDGLARRVLPGRWNLLPVLLWFTGGVMEFPVLSYHWMASGCAILTLWAGLHWVEQPSPASARGLGVGVALSGWMLQSEGLVAVLMVAFLWLRFRPAQLHQVWLSGLLASLVLWLPCWQSWPQLVSQHLGLSGHLSFNRKLYGLDNWWAFLSHYPPLSLDLGLVNLGAIGSHLFINGLRYLVTPLLWVLTLGLAERRRDRAALVLVYGFLAWVLGTANRHTLTYVSFLNPGWVLLLSKSLQLLPRGSWLAGALALGEVSGWAFRGYVRSQTFLYPIATRQGVYFSNDPAEAASFGEVQGWLRELPPGTPVLCFPYAMYFYTLQSLKNPVRRQTLVPGLEPPQAIADSLEEVRSKQVEWLLYLPPNSQAIALEYGMEAGEVERRWEELRRQFTEGYQRVAGDERQGLYRRLER